MVLVTRPFLQQHTLFPTGTMLISYNAHTFLSVDINPFISYIYFLYFHILFTLTMKVFACFFMQQARIITQRGIISVTSGIIYM